MASSQQANAYRYILVDVEDRVGTITLNRPERGNAIQPQMGREVVQALAAFESDAAVHVVVLAASGRFFCTGMDLNISNQEQLSSDLAQGTAAAEALALFTAIKECSKPTIARVQGGVFGGGCGIVCCCDVRVMVDGSYLCFAEAKRGIVPALISAFCVPAMGATLAGQYMLTAARMPAALAYERGVISAVVPIDQLDACVGRFAAELLESGPKAMATIKRTVSYVASHTHEENLEYVQRVFAESVHSSEAMYGIQCFAQKTKPDWAAFYASGDELQDATDGTTQQQRPSAKL